MSVPKKEIPEVDSLVGEALTLAKLVAKYSLLPDKETVLAFEHNPLFLTTRDNSRICGEVICDGAVIGMYDDNTTPRWALLWSHGYTDGKHRKGWTFAHVWPKFSSTCPDAYQDNLRNNLNTYTNLANLIMVPEPLAGLTDKEGPVAAYLRFHSWDAYGWKPPYIEEPLLEPEGYREIDWHCLTRIAEPVKHVKAKKKGSKDQRIRKLREIFPQEY